MSRRNGALGTPVPATMARARITRLIEAGWTHDEIAGAARIDRGTVACILAGQDKISADAAFHICLVRPEARPCPPDGHHDEAVQAAAHAAETQRRREAQHRRWAAELAERQRAKAQRAETDVLLAALRTALFGDDDEDWRERAVCAQIDPDLWFPEKGGNTRDAKKLCLTCTVRAQCLDFAMEHEERYGVWGGRSERERRRMVKEQEAS